MLRYLLIICTLFLCVLHAAAQTTDEKPLASFCDGKYSEAAASVDAANRLFGTIYSGASHFRNYSNELSDTINLYRQIQGFDTLNQSVFDRSFGFSLSENKPTASALTRALRLMTWADPKMDSAELQNYVVLLDVLTSRGPSDDWWLRIEDFETRPANVPRARYPTREETINYGRTHVTAAQRIVADLTRRHDELDWLQSALILSTYEHPWRPTGAPLSPDLAALFEHIEKKSLGGDNNRAWLALLSHHKFYDRDVPSPVGQIQRTIAANIENCSASPADYAALMAGNYPISDSSMTPDHLDLLLEIEARHITFKTDRAPVFDALYHSEISALKDRAHDRRKFALPLILSAPNHEALEAAKQLNPNVTRPLEILSGYALENISPGAAFTRHVAMNRPSDAHRVLDIAITKRPELRTAIADILDDDLPQDMQMIMVALRLRCLSHLISDFCTLDELERMPHLHRDINKSYETGTFIQTEFRAWMFPEAARWTPSRYYLQNGLGETQYTPLHNRRRSAQRSLRYGSVNPAETKIHASFEELSPEAVTDYKAGLRQASGLMALADWTEFTAITGERRLTRALSLDVINWVRTAPADPVMAEALHRVVRLNKHQSGGDIDNQPAAKIAFELLHEKFPNSEWAKRTPVWWG